MFLKELGDARRVRERLINCFELANMPSTPKEERQRLLSFVIVGGALSRVTVDASRAYLGIRWAYWSGVCRRACRLFVRGRVWQCLGVFVSVLSLFFAQFVS